MARGTWGGALDRHPMKVRISWTEGVAIHQTGFHLRSAGVNITSPGEAATEVLEWCTDHFKTILPHTERIVGIDVVDLVTMEGASESPATLGGTRIVAAEARVPAALCFVVNMKGELRTRYGQGRMFWPILGEADLDGDVLSDSLRTAATGVIDALLAKFSGNDVTGHNLITVHGVIPAKAATPTRPARPEVPASWYDVNSIRLNGVATFLRSRKAGVGS